jgi:SHS2 domain-containing protein
MPFETFDHTADLGLRITAPTLDALFADAAAGLLTVITGDLSAVLPAASKEVTLPFDKSDLLLFDWLNHLLYLFDVEHLLFCKFEAHCDESGLHARAWGEPLDRERHPLEHEVKAITYHGLRVERTADGWLAELIVDI